MRHCRWLSGSPGVRMSRSLRAHRCQIRLARSGDHSQPGNNPPALNEHLRTRSPVIIENSLNIMLNCARLHRSKHILFSACCSLAVFARQRWSPETFDANISRPSGIDRPPALELDHQLEPKGGNADRLSNSGGSSLQLLSNDKGDLWTAGKVASDTAPR